MRFKSIIVAAGIAVASGNAHALSMLSSPAPQDQQAQSQDALEITVLTKDEKARFTDKSALSEINQALVSNRKQRSHLIELNHESESDIELDALLKVLDMRFDMLTVAGDSIIKAKTEVEIKEATALAESILQTTTDTSSAIEESWSYDTESKAAESNATEN